MTNTDPGWQDSMLELGGHPFRVRVAGQGTPVLALHGFPDSVELWRYQMPHLAAHGFRVIAPDLRGFGESWKPQLAGDYDIRKLLADVTAIMGRLGVRKAHIVGHDFGALLAWTMAALMPYRVDHLVVMSVGHPSVWQDPSAEQRRSFWHSLLFLLPEAEQLVRRGNWKLARELLHAELDAERYLADLRRPGALTAALNWYRALCHPAAELGAGRRVPAVTAPTLALWGARDRLLTEEAMLDSAEHVRGAWRYQRIEEAGHFIPLDAPGRVNRLLTDWLGTQQVTAALDPARQLWALR